jgi:Papain family cysteine protease
MKNICFCLLLCGLMPSQAAFSQNNEPPTTYTPKGKFGILDAALIDAYLKTIEGVGTSAKDALAEQSLKSYMMPPRRSVNGAPSATYALASCLEFYINLNSNYKDNLSPDFIKLSLPNTATTEDNLVFLASIGTVSAAILPFESPNLTPSVYSSVKYKIQNYLKLFQSTTRAQQKIYDVKKALMRGNPVVIELQVTAEFRNLKQTRFYDPKLGDKTAAGTQHLVVVGYDEERRAFELQNSWGRAWGNGGYIWVSYDDLGALATNGFVLLL